MLSSSTETAPPGIHGRRRALRRSLDASSANSLDGTDTMCGRPTPAYRMLEAVPGSVVEGPALADDDVLRSLASSLPSAVRKLLKVRCLQTGMVLEDELKQFHGTTRYYKNFNGLLFTDGIKHLADRAGCYWLIDLVGSYQPELHGVWFQLWEVEVVEDMSGLVTMREDLGRPVRVRQQIPYTDFPLKEFSFYCVDNVMMLKSEY